MKKGNYSPKSEMIRRFRTVVGIVLLVLSFSLPWIFARFHWLGVGDEAAVGIFSVSATVIGAILLVYELKDNERITCCNMLSEMNIRFIENDRLMLLYQELCACYQDESRDLKIDNEDPNSVHSADLMGYMTFYEVINEYVKNGVLSINQMDDLFGDRFFKLIHNRYIQENELYAEPSSYVNIFQLYTIWKPYRERNGTRLAVLSKYAIPDLYTNEKLYLRENARLFMNRDNIQFKNRKGETKTMSVRRLFPADLEKIQEIQKEITEKVDNSIFEPSSKDEIYESMLLDYCYGVFDQEKLAAVCICVINRKTYYSGGNERNLCVETSNKTSYSDYITFDSIQVAPDYRGYGIQKFFLKEAETLAANVGAKYIVATVSPDNKYSSDSFEQSGYSNYFPNDKKIEKYKSVRYLVIKNVSKKDDKKDISK